MRAHFLLLLCLIISAQATQNNPPERAGWSRVDIIRVLALLLQLIAMLVGIYVKNVPMTSQTTGLSHYQAHLHSDSSNLAAAGAYLELRAKHTDEPAFMSNFLEKYPVKRMLKAGKVWQTSTDAVVKRVEEGDVEKQVDAELTAMRLIAEKPHPGLKPSRIIYYGRGPSYVVSDYLDGVQIASLSHLSVQEAAWLLWDTARALKHLHDEISLAHHDTHLGNVMVDLRGKVQLIDFTHSQAMTWKNKPAEVQKDLYVFSYFIQQRCRQPVLDPLLAPIFAEIQIGHIRNTGQLIEAIKLRFPAVTGYQYQVAMKVKAIMETK